MAIIILSAWSYRYRAFQSRYERPFERRAGGKSRFNFKLGKREYKGDFLQMKPNDILVIEGIHSLNDRMSYSLPKESKFKIYISALTQLNVDEHNRISTTDGRLIRRMVRG